MNNNLFFVSLFFVSFLNAAPTSNTQPCKEMSDRCNKMNAAYKMLVESYDEVYNIMSALSSSGLKMNDLREFREVMALQGYPCNNYGTLWSRIVADKSLEFIVEGKFAQINELTLSLPLPVECDLSSLKKPSFFDRFFSKKNK